MLYFSRHSVIQTLSFYMASINLGSCNIFFLYHPRSHSKFMVLNTNHQLVLESGLGLETGLESSNSWSWSWSRTRVRRDQVLDSDSDIEDSGRVLSRCFDYLFTVKLFKNHRTAITCTRMLLLQHIILSGIFVFKGVLNTVLSHLCCPLQFML